VSNDSIWDDKEIQSSGSYVKLTEKGDSIEGRILKIVKRTFTATRKGEEDSVSPELTLECADGTEKIFTAGAIRLKLELVEKRPEVGDWIKITLTDIEKRGGGRELKHWSVEIRKGEGVGPASASAETSRAKGSSAPPF